MTKAEEFVYEIELEASVDGEPKTLVIPIPYDYDGRDVLQLVLADLSSSPDKKGAAAAPVIDDGTAKVSGAMSEEAFADWSTRAKELSEIDTWAGDLEGTGLLPGEWPGIYDDRTNEPTTLMLDETIDNDLHNVTVMRNETKAAFRVMRETSGASQADLAQALGVNVRAVKRWETPGQPEPPHDAWRLIEGWHADARIGARWHLERAKELRDDAHEAYTLVIYRNQEEFDHALAPLLANAPSYHWQDALAEAKAKEERHESWYEIDHEYTNFPGTRSYWRANAAAKLAAALMEAEKVPYGFAYPGEQRPSLFWEGVWVPRADVQRIELSDRTIVTCGMR